MTTVLPYAIFVGAAGAAAILFVAFWERIVALLTPRTEPYREKLERAAIKMRAEELIFAIVGTGVALWGLTLVLVHTSLPIGAALLPLYVAAAFYACGLWVDQKIRKRLDAFNNQLEVVLRMMASGLRVGLGLRQSMIVVVNEAAEPARSEFARVLGQTAIGVSIYDALDKLSERMPSNEITMMTRSIRVQSQTGGNLARVLETLAETIKQRRRVLRKMKALTAEARSSGYVVSGLPLLVGGIIMLFQEHMRVAMLTTFVGRMCLLGVLVLVGLGQLWMNKLSDLEV